MQALTGSVRADDLEHATAGAGRYNLQQRERALRRSVLVGSTVGNPMAAHIRVHEVGGLRESRMDEPFGLPSSEET
jgi:hypothetical protein